MRDVTTVYLYNYMKQTSLKLADCLRLKPKPISWLRTDINIDETVTTNRTTALHSVSFNMFQSNHRTLFHVVQEQ